MLIAGSLSLMVMGVLAVGPAGGGSALAVPSGAYLTVPWAIGGERIEADGSRGWYSGDWPTMPVAGLRIWDARTAWLNIEMVPGEYSFARLDAFVAKAEARGVSEIVLVLGGTPRWAAARIGTQDAPWLGPGSASPPRRLSDWTEFVQSVASRYRGRIDAYEIWNEPNSPVYWNGTRGEWAALVVAAQRAIESADPAATVVASGFALPLGGSARGLAPWIRALRSAGCALCLDAVSVHWYPKPGFDPESMQASVSSLRAIAERAGVAGDVWVTEMNVRGGAALSRERQGVEARALQRAAAASGARRAYWYAWTDLDPSGLLQIFRGTPAARVLATTSG